MPAKLEQKTIVILWEHEIRTAVMALHQLNSIMPETSIEDQNKIYTSALKACWAAIYHGDIVNGSPITIMSAAEDMKRSKP